MAKAQPLTGYQKAIRVSNRDELHVLLHRCNNLTKEQVLDRLHDPYISIIEETLLRSLVKDLELSDTKTLDKILDRLYGKAVQVVSQQIEVKTLEDIVAESAKDITPVDDI